MAFKTKKGFDISNYDQGLVKQAQRGKQWDSNDQARYDALVKSRQQKQKPKGESTPKNKGKGGGVGSGMGKGGGGRTNGLTPANPMGRGPATKPGAGKKTNGRTKAKQIGQNRLKGNNPNNPNKTNVITKPDNRQTQNVKQDNDINTNITGDNNKVFNEQDNSIRQYGGDNRTFVYNASQQGDGFNKYEQTPVSQATMAGFYAPDDSPAAQAKFTDLYSTLNRDNQKRYAGDAMKVANKYMMDARDYTPQSMENYLNKSIQYSYDKADVQTGSTFGDIWNPNYITENWQMPDPPKEITSDAKEIADEAKKDIEDI